MDNSDQKDTISQELLPGNVTKPDDRTVLRRCALEPVRNPVNGHAVGRDACGNISTGLGGR